MTSTLTDTHTDLTTLDGRCLACCTGSRIVRLTSDTILVLGPCRLEFAGPVRVTQVEPVLQDDPPWPPATVEQQLADDAATIQRMKLTERFST